jgi:hypothetical protein
VHERGEPRCHLLRPRSGSQEPWEPGGGERLRAPRPAYSEEPPPEQAPGWAGPTERGGAGRGGRRAVAAGCGRRLQGPARAVSPRRRTAQVRECAGGRGPLPQAPGSQVGASVSAPHGRRDRTEVPSEHSRPSPSRVYRRIPTVPAGFLTLSFLSRGHPAQV